MAWYSMVETVPPPSVTPDPAFKARPGRQRLSDWQQGLDVPPFARAVGMRPTRVAAEVVEYEMPVSAWLRTHAEVVPGSALAYLVDAPLGGAILSSIEDGRAITTSQLSIDYLRPAPAGLGRIAASGKVTRVGRTTAAATGSVVAGGAVIAHASTRCVVIDAPPGQPRPVEGTPSGASLTERPVVETAHLSDSELASMTGADVLEAVRDGVLLPSPFQKLTGIRPVHVAEDGVVLEMPAAEWYRSPGPHLYGGALFMLADAAASAAVQGGCPAGVVHAPLDLTAHFVRPVVGDGQPLRAHGRVLHRGRSLAVSQVIVETADGRAAVYATGSSALMTGTAAPLRPWRRGEPGDHRSVEFMRTW